MSAKDAMILPPGPSHLLKQISLFFEQGLVEIEIYDDDTLLATHHCNFARDQNHTAAMNHFVPNPELTVLACSRCHFRIEIPGFPIKDFKDKINPMTITLDRLPNKYRLRHG